MAKRDKTRWVIQYRTVDGGWAADREILAWDAEVAILDWRYSTPGGWTLLEPESVRAVQVTT